MTFLVIDGTIHWLSISNLFLKKKSLKLKDASALTISCNEKRENFIERKKKENKRIFTRSKENELMKQQEFIDKLTTMLVSVK